MTDSISQLVSTIKNGYLARKNQVFIPYSKFKEKILSVLEKEGFLEKVEIEGEKQKKQLVCFLGYKDKKPILTEIKVISKPGLRVYQTAKKGKNFLKGLKIRIVSTPQGVMKESEAVKKNLGGEVILEVY